MLGIAEVGWLIGMGVLAGLITARLDMGLKIPGHAILRGVVPIALGVSLVPRRNAGTLLGFGSLLGLVTSVAAWGSAPGIGSTTSVILWGPVLDRVLQYSKSRQGARLYVSFAMAGLMSNYLALTVRAIPKFFAVDSVRTDASFAWLAKSLVTYALCGIIAGIVSAAIGFRLTNRTRESSP